MTRPFPELRYDYATRTPVSSLWSFLIRTSHKRDCGLWRQSE